MLIAAAVALVFGVILAATRFGRYTYAIGSNEEVSRRAGINVDAHLIKVYAIAGTPPPGWPASCRSRALQPRRSAAIRRTPERDRGVVIGGTSLFGGIGTMVGTVVMLYPCRSAQRLRNRRRPDVLAAGGGGCPDPAVYLDQLRRARYRR